MLIDWLQDERVTRRVAVGLMVGLVCMYGAWTAGFFFLPEGALRGKTGAGAISALLPENASVFLLALVWNGAVAFVVMPLVCLLAVRRLSLGYILAWGNFALFGIFLGTNSFGNPRPEPLAPRLEVFTGTGVWEISAYVLVAAALANRYRFRQRGWLSSATTRISRKGNSLTNGQRATLIVAAVLIVVTAWVEHRRATAHRESSAVGMRANSAVHTKNMIQSDRPGPNDESPAREVMNGAAACEVSAVRRTCENSSASMWLTITRSARTRVLAVR